MSTGDPSSIRAPAEMSRILPSRRVERLHGQLPLADEAVHDDAARLGTVADHHHGSVRRQAGRLGHAQHLVPRRHA